MVLSASGTISRSFCRRIVRLRIGALISISLVDLAIVEE
jgi:hypothetical protein